MTGASPKSAVGFSRVSKKRKENAGSEGPGARLVNQGSVRKEEKRGWFLKGK